MNATRSRPGARRVAGGARDDERLRSAHALSAPRRDHHRRRRQPGPQRRDPRGSARPRSGTGWRSSASGTGSAAWPRTGKVKLDNRRPGRDPDRRRHDPRHQPRQAPSDAECDGELRDMTDAIVENCAKADLRRARLPRRRRHAEERAPRSSEEGLNVMMLPKTIDNDVAGDRRHASASIPPSRSRPTRSTGCTARPTATTGSSSPSDGPRRRLARPRRRASRAART